MQMHRFWVIFFFKFLRRLKVQMMDFYVTLYALCLLAVFSREVPLKALNKMLCIEISHLKGGTTQNPL